MFEYKGWRRAVYICKITTGKVVEFVVGEFAIEEQSVDQEGATERSSTRLQGVL